MKKKIFVFVILTALAFSPIFSDQKKGVKDTVTSYYQDIKIDFENQWALIVAVNEYNHLSRLRYPVKEAQQIEALLKSKYGYSPKKIKTLLDKKATYNAIMNQLKWYVKHLTDKDNLFIYFSGHGYKDDILKKGFWMPCDAGYDKQRIRNEKEMATETLVKISNHDLVAVLRECSAKHIFVVADSCFSGQFFASQHKVDRIPATHYKLKSRQLFASGRELVGDGDFGKYFVRFLEANQEPYLLASDLISNIRTIVINNTDLEPEGKPVRNTGDEGGEFILVRRLASLKQIEYKPNLPTETAAIDVSRLIAEAERKRLQRQKEKEAWQTRLWEFQKDVEKQQKIDEDKTISFTSKKHSWETILSKYKNNNPYSGDDEELRKFVSGRIEYWKAKEREEIKWANWQRKFKDNVEKLKGIDKNLDISSASKKGKWQELLKAYEKNNPYSEEDEILRRYVKEKVRNLPDDSIIPGSGNVSPKMKKKSNSVLYRSASRKVKSKSNTTFKFKRAPPIPQKMKKKSNYTFKHAVPISQKMKKKSNYTSNIPTKKSTSNSEIHDSNPFGERINKKAKRIYKNSKGFWEADYGDEIIMVYIPPGEFTMGSNDGFFDEKPTHTVYLDGYWIGKYEVTFAQYDKYCEETKKKKPDDGALGRGKRPVINVSWYDAQAYCDWLSKKTGLKFKLPTEAQWEKAARGTDGRKYPWGNHDPYYNRQYYANYDPGKIEADGYRYTAPVGSFPKGASPYGLLDMAGNVLEWCSDWYDENYYKNSPGNNPTGPISGVFRVIRGGSYRSIASELRCACREDYYPSRRSQGKGFRLCQEDK